MTKPAADIQAEFKQALDLMTSRLNRDEQVLAVILMGSLSYDQVWEKSDIDLKLVVQDQKLSRHFMSLIENNVTINMTINTRNDFKRWMESSVQSSIDHSILVKSKLLFSKDPSIGQYFENIGYVGERDRQLMLLQLGCHTLSLMAKAEKWCYVKGDPVYSALWMLKMVDLFSQIEVTLNGEVPMRESVQQALKFNPEFFQSIYTEMICGEVDEAKVRDGLDKMNEYLDRHTERLFRPVLDYLKQERDVRTITDLEERLAALVSLDAGSLVLACDWLTERGYLIKAYAETKATPKSRVPLQEPAFLYEATDDYPFEG